MLSTSNGGSHAAERAPHAGASGGPTQSGRFVVDDGHARIALVAITGSCRAAAGERCPRTIEWELVLLRSGARLLPIRQDMFDALALGRSKPQRILGDHQSVALGHAFLGTEQTKGLGNFQQAGDEEVTGPPQ